MQIDRPTSRADHIMAHRLVWAALRWHGAVDVALARLGLHQSILKRYRTTGGPEDLSHSDQMLARYQTLFGYATAAVVFAQDHDQRSLFSNHSHVILLRGADRTMLAGRLRFGLDLALAVPQAPASGFRPLMLDSGEAPQPALHVPPAPPPPGVQLYLARRSIAARLDVVVTAPRIGRRMLSALETDGASRDAHLGTLAALARYYEMAGIVFLRPKPPAGSRGDTTLLSQPTLPPLGVAAPLSALDRTT